MQDASKFGIYLNEAEKKVVRINSPYWFPEEPEWVFVTPEVNATLLSIRELAREQGLSNDADFTDLGHDSDAGGRLAGLPGHRIKKTPSLWGRGEGLSSACGRGRNPPNQRPRLLCPMPTALRPLCRLPFPECAARSGHCRYRRKSTNHAVGQSGCSSALRAA